jgi:hypothetical protein
MRMLLFILAGFGLSGCIINTVPAPAADVPIVQKALPTPVWPDACVADWYAKVKLPACVESWITDIDKQQNKIVAKKKELKAKLKSKPDEAVLQEPAN